MSKSILCFAASALALGAMVGAAQAKMVRYEINGQHYSYSTNNRQQTEEARRRIAAANAAAAARAKAEAERKTNPLASMLGSQTQREASEAQARLQQLLAPPAASAEKPSSPQATRTAGTAGRKRAAAERRDERRKVAARPERDEAATRTAGTGKRAAAERRDERRKIAARPERDEPNAERQSTRPARPAPASRAKSPAVAHKDVPAPPAVQSIHFDPAAGIKTVHMSDGTVHEEPFEVGALPQTGEGKDQNRLTGAAGQLPKPEDTTSALWKPAGKAP